MLGRFRREVVSADTKTNVSVYGSIIISLVGSVKVRIG